MTLTELIKWIQNQETESFQKRLTTPKIVDRYRKQNVGLSLYIEPKAITKEAQLLMLKYISENGLFLGKLGWTQIKPDFLVYRAYYDDNDIEPIEQTLKQEITWDYSLKNQKTRLK